MKFSFFKVRTISQSIWVIFTTTLVIFLLFFGCLYLSMVNTTNIAYDINYTEKVEREFLHLNEDILNAEIQQQAYLITTDKKYLQPYLDSISEIKKQLENLRSLVRYTEVIDILDKITILTSDEISKLSNVVELVQTGQQNKAISIIRISDKNLITQFRELNNNAIALELSYLQNKKDVFIKQIENTLLVFLIGGGIVVISLSGAAFKTTKKLAKPVSDLLDGIERMSQDNFTQFIKVTDEYNEIGRIAKGFNEVCEHLLITQEERDKFIKELERSNAELDNFAYVASHDLKAPLRAIRSLSEWIADDVEEIANEETKENLKLLNNRVDRLDKLLESLLTYSRVGRVQSSIEIVDCNKLVDDIRDYLAPKAGFEVICANKLPILSTPKAPLEQVLRNLINNALKHHDNKEGKVIISSYNLGDFIEFRIEDDGAGISPEFHHKVFQMFQTLKPRDEVEGSGMGLAIVKKIIENFHGSIRIESNPNSKRGCIFIFTWIKEFAKDSIHVSS